MSNWERVVEERKRHLQVWYDKIAEVGHGEITISFNRENSRIDINPTFRTRDGEALKILGIDQ